MGHAQCAQPAFDRTVGSDQRHLGANQVVHLAWRPRHRAPTPGCTGTERKEVVKSLKPGNRISVATGLRLLIVIAFLAAGLLSYAHASTSGGSTAVNRAPNSSAETRVIGLGDSVPAAAGCACTSFVQLFGNDVGRHTGQPNHTDNYARNGLD